MEETAPRDCPLAAERPSPQFSRAYGLGADRQAVLGSLLFSGSNLYIRFFLAVNYMILTVFADELY